MKNKIRNIGLFFVLGMLFMFIIKPKKVETIKVPFRVEIKIPVIEYVHDTVYKPSPIFVKGDKEIDSTYYAEYIKLKDSIAKDSLFKKAITINEYNEKIEDDTITIDLYMKSRGTVLAYQVGYKTKPRNILFDTILEVDIPSHKNSLTLYSEIGIPFSTKSLDAVNISRPVFKAGLDIKNKKNWIFGASYDTDKRAWLKLGKTFNF